VLVGDDLPELGTDLVTALATLDVHNLTARDGRVRSGASDRGRKTAEEREQTSGGAPNGYGEAGTHRMVAEVVGGEAESALTNFLRTCREANPKSRISRNWWCKTILGSSAAGH
jgi:hypothetical protein